MMDTTAQHHADPRQEAPAAPNYFRPHTADGQALHDDDYHGGEETPLTPSVNGGAYHNQYGGEHAAATGQAAPSPSNPGDDQSTTKRRIPFVGDISKKTQRRLYW